MKNRSTCSDTWLTPRTFYDQLNDRFHFDDFDPCPATYDPGGDFCGLKVSWAPRTYCNPGYSQKVKEAFILKALEESKLGKLAVLLIPVSTSTRIFHRTIQPQAQIEFIEGRLPFEGLVFKVPKDAKDGIKRWHHVNKGLGMVPMPNVPEDCIQVKANGQHDSMLVIFGAWDT
jgi:DNA N-6-adenine-methyltransferase (Dam)